MPWRAQLIGDNGRRREQFWAQEALGSISFGPGVERQEMTYSDAYKGDAFLLRVTFVIWVTREDDARHL